MPVKKLKEKNWEFRFKIGGVERRRKNFATKQEAMLAEQKCRKEFLMYDDKENDLKTIYSMYKIKRGQKLKLSTLEKDEGQIEKYIFPYFKELSKITRPSLFAWKKKIVELKMSERYTNQILKCFRGLLTFASTYSTFDAKLLTELDNVSFHEIKEEMKIWSLEEFDKFINTFEEYDPFKLLFTTLYYSGLRISELLALTKKDIKGNELDINKRLESRVGNEKFLTTLKTQQSNRRVLMPEFIINQLKQIDNKDSAYLFPCGLSTIRRHHEKHCKLANVPIIRLHDFRHSHASFLINNGASIRLVSERLGHSSPSITMDVYWHIMKDEQSKIINVIQGAKNDKK